MDAINSLLSHSKIICTHIFHFHHANNGQIGCKYISAGNHFLAISTNTPLKLAADRARAPTYSLHVALISLRQPRAQYLAMYANVPGHGWCALAMRKRISLHSTSNTSAHTFASNALLSGYPRKINKEIIINYVPFTLIMQIRFFNFCPMRAGAHVPSAIAKHQRKRHCMLPSFNIHNTRTHTHIQWAQIMSSLLF